ncbi:MAG: Gfo/Idh/MocA family oxidoreductase [Chloroflexi bacterium]|nr:Gfo/Idh/MocA family oxidoreductase [Chloroflexota bacterium]
MKVGLLGAGRIGAFHAKTLASNSRVSSLRIMDVDAARAQSLADDLGASTASTAAELSDWADALVIATATDTHADLIRLGAEAGLPVFCEKPISLDLRSTDDVLRAVDKAGTPLQIGFQRRFDRGFAEIRRIIESGELGTLYSARLATHDPAPPPEEYVKVSGGIFLDLMVHDFDIIRWTTGLEVEAVFAAGSVLTGVKAFSEANDVDTAVVILRLTGGVQAILSGLRHNPRGYDVRLEVFGSKDSVVAGMDGRSPIHLIESDLPSGANPEYRDFFERFEPAYQEELNVFLSVARGEIESPCSGRDAREALRIAVAATKSLHEKRPVALEDIS